MATKTAAKTAAPVDAHIPSQTELRAAEDARAMADLVEHGMAKLAEEMQAGLSENFLACLAVMSKFHSYSPNNQMLIAWQRPTASLVAGFHTWKNLGRSVKKGERGIRILAPIGAITRTVTVKDRETGEERDEVVRIPRFRDVFVFDVAQTEGAELPEFFRPLGDDGATLLANLVAAMRAQGMTVEFDDEMGTAQGVCSGPKSVRVRKTLDATNQALAAIHEWAHALLHWGADRPNLSRRTKEAQAEATAYIVARACGLEHPFAADYIAHWGTDAKSLAAELAAVQKAATHILAAIKAGDGRVPYAPAAKAEAANGAAEAAAA